VKESEDVADDDGLKVLEVSYTYRGFEDDAFLARVGGEEWAEFVMDGPVGLAVGLVPENAPADDATSNPESEEAGKTEKQNEGILPFAVDSRASEGLRKRFKGVSRGSLGKLKMLDLTLWTLRSNDVAQILNSCTGEQDTSDGIVELTLSVLMEDGWLQKLAEALSLTGKSIEGIEIIGVPSHPKEMRAAAQNGKSEGTPTVALLEQPDLEELSAVCPNLSRLTMTILRAKRFGGVAWTKVKEGSWEEKRA